MFTETKIAQTVLDNAGICQNCFIKFNEYDEHQTMAIQIQNELMGMYSRGATSSFVDVKQEIKVEDEELFYGLEDSIVEEDFGYQKEQPRRKLAIKQARSIAGVAVARKAPYKKKDKDAGLLVCMVEGVKHYQCEFCGKKDFTSRSRLKSHKQIHTSERNFMCQVWKGTAWKNCF